MNTRKFIPLLFIFSTFNGSIAQAQEFQAPSMENLTYINTQKLNQINEILSIPKEEIDCSEKIGGTGLNVKKYQSTYIKKSVYDEDFTSGENEVTCFCDNPYRTDEVEQISYMLVGGNRKSELKLTSGNDNFFHGLLMFTPLKKFDGDDRGRTFSGSVDYSLVGDKGELKLKFDSTGFSVFDPKYGIIDRSPEGKYYLNFRERTSLDISLSRNFNQTKKQNGYFIGNFNFTHETDEGRFSRRAQEWWHRIGRESFDINNIQYEYVKKENDVNTISLMLGVGHNYMSDIGNWRCQTRVEALVGLSTDASRVSTPEVRSRAIANIAHKTFPWATLSAWLEASNGFRGPVYEGGLGVAFERKMKNVKVKPFVGVERHIDSIDKKFGTLGGRAYEIYHVFGVTIIY